MRIDVSLILNLHREGRYVRRTLMSLGEATAYASAEGIVVELVIVLDRADTLTREVVQHSELSTFPHLQIIETDHGSLGPARNSGCAVARGKYLRLCDGDDLLSFNFISVMFHEAELRGPNAIFICEWLFGFGARYHAAQFFGLEKITPLALCDNHPFVSAIFFTRDLISKIRFSDLRLSAGYAYEDWHFNAEAVATGCEIFVARNTILFYRQREDGLLSQANKISAKQIPPSKLFEPQTFLKVCADAYRRLSSEPRPRIVTKTKRFLESDYCRYLVAAANRIEPAIELSLIRESHEYLVAYASNLQVGKRYYEICRSLTGGTFDNIFLVPFFGRGGGERYVAKIIQQLVERGEKVLVLLGQPHETNEWLELLPESVMHVDLAKWRDDIGDAGIDVIALKLIQALGPRSRLHVRTSDFGQRFLQRYGRALRGHQRIYYRFSQEMRRDPDADFALPYGFQFLSEMLDDIDVVLSDNSHLIRHDRERFGVDPKKWRLLRSHMEPILSRCDVIAKAGQPSTRILWASRIAREKRPDILLAIASKLLVKRPDLMIEVHGEPTSEFSPSAMFQGLPNILYKGAYSSFEAVASGNFLCFLYTTAFDGLPNVLLEAASMGLPVVAPDIGGVSDFVKHQETGVLLPPISDTDSLAEAYLSAILQLEEDPALRRRLVEKAYNRLVSEHGLGAFKRAVADAFDLDRKLALAS